MASRLAVFHLQRRVRELELLIDTPETDSFDSAVPLEAAHQVKRFGVKHDQGKSPEDWFWLVGYLAGKALRAHLASDQAKALHHCISTAAALRNWHAHVRSGSSLMRPGIENPETEQSFAVPMLSGKQIQQQMAALHPKKSPKPRMMTWTHGEHEYIEHVCESFGCVEVKP